ncbi:hypothetical protein ACHQM5_019745 [Ranunculus cassubicifolius]
MRCLCKWRALYSITRKPLTKTQSLNFPSFQASLHSIPSKFRKKPKPQNTKLIKTHEEFTSIFTEITDIIGIERPPSTEKSDSLEISDAHTEISKKNRKDPTCTQGVCGNVQESTKVINLDEIDVSPIVHKITEIVRGEVSMENRLGEAGFVFDSEIVEKVLKRCFKVGNLALRFFNWVRNEVGFCHTTETYNTMIYIAGEAKEFNVMEELVEEMEKEGCTKDIKTWTILVSCYGKGKLIGKALLLFEKMKKSGCQPDGIVYKVIVQALCDVGKADIAMEIYKEMVSKIIEVDINLYTLLLNCLSRSGHIKEVRLIGEDMINISEIPEQKVYSCILRSFCIARQIREALGLLHELKNKKILLDPENFEILVRGLCRDGKISDALEIVDIMKQNHVVDGKIYGFIINGYIRRNEASKAFEMFSSMKISGHTPTNSTYTEMMQYLFRSNDYDKACKLYDEMLENGIQPDTVTMTALLAGHIQNNHVPEAWKVFDIMNEKGIKATHKSYSVAIKELCKVSETDEALKLVNRMKESQIKVGDEVYQIIICALEKKGELEKIDRVKKMWKASVFYGQEREFPIDHQSPYRGTEMVMTPSSQPKEGVNYSKKQKNEHDVQLVRPVQRLFCDQDLQVVCRILSSPINWSSMQDRLENCTVPFTPELVLEVLRRCQLHGHAALSFFSWVGQQACYSHTTETYNMAIKVSGCAKDFKHMRKMYHEMKRKNCLITSDTWTIMIMQYGRAGLTEIALRNFEEMKDDGCLPNRSTYKYLILLLCGKKGRKIDEAIKIFHQMIKAGHVPDKELAEIYMSCLCEVAKLSEARRCMDSLRKCGFSVPLSYSLVIRSLCRAGKIDEALAFLDEAGEGKSTLDQYIYGSLVHGLLRAGRVEEALAKVDAMKQMGVTPTVHVYTSLIVHFFKEKQIDRALEMFKEMREEGCEPTVVTYSALIRGYINMSMISDARNIYRRMKLKGPLPDFKMYSMFISCLCEVGMSEEALQVINEMLECGICPSTVNFRTVFYGLNREGKHDIAQTVLQKKWALASERKFSQ